MMRNRTVFRKFSILLVAATCLCGCYTGTEASIQTPEGVMAVKALIEDNMDKEKALSLINFSTKNIKSTELEQVSFDFFEDGKKKMWFYSFSLSKLLKPNSATKTQKPEPMQPLSAFPLEEIPEYLAKATTMITNETSDFKNFKFGHYFLKATSSKTFKHSFSVLAHLTGKQNSFFGKHIENEIYKFEFSTNADGTLKCTQGLGVFNE